MPRSARCSTLGRFGESEAVFTLFAGGALLVWHWGYLRGWPAAASSGRPPIRWRRWGAGQGVAGARLPASWPAAPTWLLRRDWRLLFGRGHLLGLACFARVGRRLVGSVCHLQLVGGRRHLGRAWPQTGSRRTACWNTWCSYPLETFGCLLPWSPLLLALLKPSVCRALLDESPAGAIPARGPGRHLSQRVAGGRRAGSLLHAALSVPGGADGAGGRTLHRLRPPASTTAASWRLFLRGAASSRPGRRGRARGRARMHPVEQLADARQPLAFLVPWMAAAAGRGRPCWSGRRSASERRGRRSRW